MITIIVIIIISAERPPLQDVSVFRILGEAYDQQWASFGWYDDDDDDDPIGNFRHNLCVKVSKSSYVKQFPRGYRSIAIRDYYTTPLRPLFYPYLSKIEIPRPVEAIVQL